MSIFGVHMLNKAIQFALIVSVLGAFMFIAGRLNQTEGMVFPKVYYYPGEDTTGVDQQWMESIHAAPLFWLKSSVILDRDHLKSNLQIALDLSGSFEIFWNGNLVGENGTFSVSPNQEVPGYTYSTFIIPASQVRDLQNVLSIRVSHHARTSSRINPKITIGSYRTVSKTVLVSSVVIHFLAGIFFIVSIYYAFLYFISYRKASFILFSLLCLAGFFLIVLGFSKVYLPIRYDLYEIRFWVFKLVSFLVALGTPVFLLYHFNVPHKQKIIPLFGILSVIAWMLPNNYSWVALVIGFGAQFLVTIWAMFRQRPGSVEVLVGLLTFVIGFIYFNISIYLGFSILVVAILFSLSLSFREERRKQEAAELRSARLRAELLRKNIQPHFLMNTLTTIISMIETDPKSSIELIETLSQEFSTLSEIADKKLIDLGQELELCNSYMKVMSIRNDIEYTLIQNVAAEMKIPPAIIHTLIENGISHNQPINGCMNFEVSANIVEHGRQLIEVTSFGKVADDDSNGVQEGTGLKYVRARLEESFMNRWDIKHESSGQHWKTTITIES